MNCSKACFVNRSWLAAACFVLAAPAATAAVSCGFVSSSSLAFGGYDALAATPTDTVTTMLVRCDSLTPGNPNLDLTISIGAGRNGGSVTNRRMRQVGGAGDYLAYGLFRDPGRSLVWGYTPGVDAHTISVKVQNTRTVDATITVYGRIPPRQNVSVGDYGDAVQVTVSP